MRFTLPVTLACAYIYLKYTSTSHSGTSGFQWQDTRERLSDFVEVHFGSESNYSSSTDWPLHFRSYLPLYISRNSTVLNREMLESDMKKIVTFFISSLFLPHIFSVLVGNSRENEECPRISFLSRLSFRRCDWKVHTEDLMAENNRLGLCLLQRDCERSRE